MSDLVNHPKHYGGADNVYEAIKVIEDWHLGFNLGNAVKYISRAGRKDSYLQDIKKAAWYLQREIQNIEALKANRSCMDASDVAEEFLKTKHQLFNLPPELPITWTPPSTTSTHVDSFPPIGKFNTNDEL
tara:strand:+ start:341 stop:730 length:390 start_codon:yes stop_codon:yes gene_type:complete